MPLLVISAVFTVMVALGLSIVPRELLWVRERPGLLGRGLFSVLVVAPGLAVAAAQAFALPRWLEIGLALMAISPGAPVALRRSLGAGGHRLFAPALQLSVAILAVVSLPVWVAILNLLYGGQAWIAPAQVARQVFIVQLLPLGIGLLLRHYWPKPARWLEPRVARLGTLLLLVVLLLLSITLASALMQAGLRFVATSLVVTLLAVAAGHLLGGPGDDTRTAVAVTSAARNPGLALLVATANRAPAEVSTAILAHLLVSAIVLTPYIVWRQRSRA